MYVCMYSHMGGGGIAIFLAASCSEGKTTPHERLNKMWKYMYICTLTVD